VKFSRSAGNLAALLPFRRPRWTRPWFVEGLGFEGSSIRGFQAINESDMLLIPDVSTAFVDPVLSCRRSRSSAMCMIR